ncbi:alpha/beta hydrolase [Actinoallomurus iriomotensis]|uniref:Alpha/beta hydrolase n=1 Tax=Actinoallomurus iriomotensis TaxID=478107 RepID=A0A9W6VS96_9ACTN|nr:alpha/beta hydrolase [Actinoallomurus iriomotensis]
MPVSIPAVGRARIYGELCVPEGAGGRARTVQLLVHGGTYDHNYFDWPQDPGRYSYVDKALKAGYPTFNVDRLGDGESSRPPGVSDTFENGAEAMHQVIAKLRDGGVGGRPFSRVVWVGHSMGSLTAWFEAHKYHDVDAFVLTGALHNVNLTFATKLANLLGPAIVDDKFRGKILDPGYLTSLPGTRGDTFYYRPGVDQAVIDEDERLKQTISVPELAQITAVELPPLVTLTRSITVPTLLVMGDHDGAFCGPPVGHDCTPASILAAEKPYYRPEARLRVVVARNSGHDLQLHRSAPEADAAITQWLDGLS